MRTLIIITLVCLAFILSGKVNAQKVQLVSGDLDFLKGQTAIKIEYDDQNMTVIGYNSEEEYISFIVNEKNNSEPGSGDKWQEAWLNDKTDRFQPRFEEIINKQLKKYYISFSADFEDEKYTMIVKTTSMDQKKTVGMIAVDIIFYETVTPDNIVAKITMPKVGGSGFTTGFRFENAYMLCGNYLAKYIAKNVFK